MLSNVIHRTSLWLRFLTCGSYLVIIAYLSLSNLSFLRGVSRQFPGIDKVVHFLLYGGLAALLCWAFWNWRQRLRNKIAILLSVVAYGILMEIFQSLFTSGMRAFEWTDIAANTFGATIFWFAANWTLKRVPQPPEK
jgi:VanZ family protein